MTINNLDWGGQYDLILPFIDTRCGSLTVFDLMGREFVVVAIDYQRNKTYCQYFSNNELYNKEQTEKTNK